MALAATALLGGCSSTPEDTYKEASADVLYNTALDDLHAGDYAKAAKEFDQVEQQHPYSTWATKAQLMEIYAQYEGDKYDDAISAADRFIQLHPGNRDIAYAYYLKAVSYYEQIVDVGRDQRDTELAQKALQDVVTRFPDTRYARDARLKLDLTRDHLAGKEMEIGRYYEGREQYIAAINRFRSVIADYQTTTHVPEALSRLAECYLAIGQKEEARQTAAVLGYNFPDSHWYKDTYKLVGGASPADRAQVAKLQTGSSASSDAAASSAIAQGGDASDDKPGWFGRTFGSLF